MGVGVGAAGCFQCWATPSVNPTFTLDKAVHEKGNVKCLCLWLKSCQPSVATRFTHAGQALRLVVSDVTVFPVV